MYISRFSSLLFFLLFSSFSVFSEVEIDYEIDPYYSNIGFFIPLDEEEIPTIELANEPEIYLSLLKNAFTPRFFVLELSVNPLPILGVYMNEQQNELYSKGQLTENLNLISALTEGFEEPYAVSFFLGNVIKFTLPNQKHLKAINKGYSGILLSVGDQHIRSNNQFSDHWYEFEWKLKGDRRIENIYHSFSFRVGVKNHENVNIQDSFYFGVRREFFNSKIADYHYYDNIGVDIRFDFSQESNDLIHALLFIDKHWPTENGELSFGIGLSTVDDKYLNKLESLNQDLQLILRPSIKF